MARKRFNRKHQRFMPFRKRLWIKQRYRCGICKRQIRQRHLFSDDVNIDHIRPRSHGGSSDPKNLQLTHFACNAAKGSQCAGCERCQND